MSEILVHYQANVVHALNGKEVIDFISAEPSINLILMDIKMADMNGLDATREIRKKNISIPIIVQTAYASENDRNNALSAGCNDIITKPVNKTELINIISKTILSKELFESIG